LFLQGRTAEAKKGDQRVEREGMETRFSFLGRNHGGALGRKKRKKRVCQVEKYEQERLMEETWGAEMRIGCVFPQRTRFWEIRMRMMETVAPFLKGQRSRGETR